MIVHTINGCTLINGDSQSQEVIDYVNHLLIDEKASIISDPPYFDVETHTRGMGRKRKVYKDLHKNQESMTHGFDMDVIFKKISNVSNVEYIVLFTNYKGVYDIIPYTKDNNIFKEYRKSPLMLWNKTNPPPMCNGNFISDNETIFNTRKKGVKLNIQKHQDKKTLLYVSSVMKNKIHVAQKPLELMDRLVSVHSTEEHVIYDPFMGSATTGVVALNKGRKFIGVEKDISIFGIACDRIEKADHNKEQGLDVYKLDMEYCKCKAKEEKDKLSQ